MCVFVVFFSFYIALNIKATHDWDSPTAISVLLILIINAFALMPQWMEIKSSTTLLKTLNKEIIDFFVSRTLNTGISNVLKRIN